MVAFVHEGADAGGERGGCCCEVGALAGGFVDWGKSIVGGEGEGGLRLQDLAAGDVGARWLLCGHSGEGSGDCCC